MGHGTTHFKNTSIKPQVRAIDYILGQSKDDLVALVVRVEDDSIFVHLMRWIRVLLLALLTACVACLAVPRGRSNFGDAVGGFNMKLSTDQIFKKNLLEQQVQMAMKSDSSREVYDDIMIAAHGVGAYRRILEGIDPPRLMQAREEMLSFLPAGTRTEVLEIGCGVGPLASNLPLYPAGISLTGLDPDVTSDLLWPCPEGLEFHAVKGFAESLPFPAAQFDAVVGSLVMCSVDKPQRMLTEIARVLKPKGRYLFLEHIHAPKGCALHWQQKILDPLHSYCCGCRLTRQLGVTGAARLCCDKLPSTTSRDPGNATLAATR
ncbi:unnamed protein product [Cladocopium goreaui]|uniref:Methyltransferase-like protein 7A n=1 Tax=Cladocopium goreaui TaxID=2562237 RepID=A0A9P1DDG1_9DINO|nr:unnamed protein product [Cladocopium goreaui]